MTPSLFDKVRVVEVLTCESEISCEDRIQNQLLRSALNRHPPQCAVRADCSCFVPSNFPSADSIEYQPPFLVT